MKERKPRNDSKLRQLSSEHRALVDKWLFDKGMGYQAVAEGCLKMFGLKISKSSVGRYYALAQTARVHTTRKKSSDCVGGQVSDWARDMCVGMLSPGEAHDPGQACQKTLEWMTKWALQEMEWVAVGEGDLKGVLRVMRILISARRERNAAEMARLRRKKFELKAAKQCFQHLKRQEREARVRRREEAKWRIAAGESRWPERGEKDPNMVWNFGDGEIRRLPLMRERDERRGGED